MFSYGKLFQIHIWGSSHAKEMGILIEGVPPGISLSPEDFTKDIERRKSGAIGTTPRIEEDIPELVAGVYQGKTSGAPLLIRFANKTQNSVDYSLRNFPRPGHADFTANKKYNSFQDPRGGGFFSGRMTLLLLAAAVVAKKIIPQISINAKILNVGGQTDYQNLLKQVIREKDSLGAKISCEIKGVPPGYGEPYFDSLESSISHLVFSIPGVKAIAFGSGENADSMKGSEFNDIIINAKGETLTNHNGGINGGISNGNPIVFSVNLKPTPSIGKPQYTWNPETDKQEKVVITGKHDVCYALRAPVIIEAISAIVLTDMHLIQKAISYE